MGEIRIVDVVDAPSFGVVPACADAAFDHRTCDYWENAVGGSRAHRPSWLVAGGGAPDQGRRPARVNPFAEASDEAAGAIAAAPADWIAAAAPPATVRNPFLEQGPADPFAENPFVPTTQGSNPFAPGGGAAPRTSGRGPSRQGGPDLPSDLPRKLGLLSRGLRVFGTYARVLLVDDRPAVYAQFGPLSAYPRAQRVRALYRQLPDAPLPAVITCVASTPEARSGGLALRLVSDVCDELARRGFSAVEAYPEAGSLPDATSAATAGFWVAAGFEVAVDDERFPVVRREL
jgi:hypothetical protein